MVFDEQTGKPLESFEIRVLRSIRNREPAPMRRRESFRDSGGQFEIGGLDPMTYVLEARAAGYAPSHSAEFVVNRGEQTPGIQVPTGSGNG